MAFSPVAVYLILCCVTSLALSFPSELPLFVSKNHMNISSLNSSLLDATIRRNLFAITHIIDVGVGTPTTRVKLVFDTGAQMTWIASDAMCNNRICSGFSKKSSRTLLSVYCMADACHLLHQGRNGHDQLADCKKDHPSACKETIRYLDGKDVDLELVRDVLTFGDESASVYFGLGIKGNEDTMRGISDGVLGMAGDGISIMNQVDFRGVFSYCLTPYASKASSTLMFENPNFPEDYEVMSFYKSDHEPHYYFVPIIGFTFNGVTMPIQKMNKAGQGGFYVDTGASFTQLMPPIFKKFLTMFEERVSPFLPDKKILADNSLHCYKLPATHEVYFPQVSILFDDGIELKLEEDNVMIYIQEYEPYDWCLAFTKAISWHNIFGNYQQQTFRFAFDMGNSLFGVKLTPECNFF